MRITPACAGNKINYSWIKYRSQDHPRVCGEQAIYVCRWVRDEGSPPRVRGTVWAAYPRKQAKGITPACAGNSDTLPISPIVPRDHPRVCGEQQNQITLVDIFRGSPPRVRGTVPIGMQVVYIFRITPACAGNSSLPSSNRKPMQDHPRVCGEQPMAGTRGRQKQGSPPRVRGTA